VDFHRSRPAAYYIYISCKTTDSVKSCTAIIGISAPQWRIGIFFFSLPKSLGHSHLMAAGAFSIVYCFSFLGSAALSKNLNHKSQRPWLLLPLGTSLPIYSI
jgi:hypothetical protein